MLRKSAVVLFLLIGAVQSCRQNDSPVGGGLTSGSYGRIDSLSASLLMPGDNLIIYGSGFDSSYWTNEISFAGKTFQADSGNAGTLYKRVPMGVGSGKISVITSQGSIQGPYLAVAYMSPTELTPVWYSGEPLTEQQSWFIGDLDTSKWSAMKSGDTITLTQQGVVGDDSPFENILKFYSPANYALPHPIKGVVLWGSRPDSIVGFVEIQNWNVNHIISGKVNMYTGNWPTWSSLVFWYKFD